MNIVTTYRTDASGKGKVTAKGGGRQRTVNYDHSKSPAANHGSAAGILGKALGLTWPGYENATSEDLGDGQWRFSL